MGLLWFIGEDSKVLLRLCKKAFGEHVSFPILDIDTSYKIPSTITTRNHMAKEWGLNLIVHKNETALHSGMGPQKGRLECCRTLKAEGLK